MARMAGHELTHTGAPAKPRLSACSPISGLNSVIRAAAARQTACDGCCGTNHGLLQLLRLSFDLPLQDCGQGWQAKVLAPPTEPPTQPPRPYSSGCPPKGTDLPLQHLALAVPRQVRRRCCRYSGGFASASDAQPAKPRVQSIDSLLHVEAIDLFKRSKLEPEPRS